MLLVVDLVLVALITAPILLAALVALVWWLIADARRERRRTRTAVAAARRYHRTRRSRDYTYQVLYSHDPDLLTHQRPHWPTRDPDTEER
ncbi:hypothetical protein [Actinokineospora sp. NPDC004072]